LGKTARANVLGHVDAVVVPTQWEEPFGRVAAEAIVSGCALIYSAVGGLPEVARMFGGKTISVPGYAGPDAWARAIDQAVAGNWETNGVINAPLDATSSYVTVYRSVLSGPSFNAQLRSRQESVRTHG
jgi:glycosyltransferase involved in cell wall biosynthesis